MQKNVLAFMLQHTPTPTFTTALALCLFAAWFHQRVGLICGAPQGPYQQKDHLCVLCKDKSSSKRVEMSLLSFLFTLCVCVANC